MIGCYLTEQKYTGTEVDTINDVASTRDCQAECVKNDACLFWSYTTEVSITVIIKLMFSLNSILCG